MEEELDEIGEERLPSEQQVRRRRRAIIGLVLSTALVLLSFRLAHRLDSPAAVFILTIVGVVASLWCRFELWELRYPDFAIPEDETPAAHARLAKEISAGPPWWQTEPPAPTSSGGWASSSAS